MNYFIVIPARMASTRFPGKPLVDILGLPMIVRVAQQAAKAQCGSTVLVATDHQAIADVCKNYGIAFAMTGSHHPSGTDRIFEVVNMLPNINDDDVIINVQGDEPFIEPSQIDQLASLFSSHEVHLATLVRKSFNVEHVSNPSVVKVVLDSSGKALYFSRSVIPYYRSESSDKSFYIHVGMYAYRYSTLKKIAKLSPSCLEQAEQLEQLRWLENGYRIYTAETMFETYAVDTPSDLEFIKKKFSS
jgi:3-deoxy-manno-octulosonate cytidylyltransferase (CMP-KDO synthetase)